MSLKTVTHAYAHGEVCVTIATILRRAAAAAYQFLVNKHISTISGQIFFSRNEFVVDLMHVPTVPALNNLTWSPTDTGLGTLIIQHFFVHSPQNTSQC